MKRILPVMVLLMGLFFMLNVYAANQVTVQIKLQQAKNIYNTMTGPAVQNEGAAGHLYRTGKSIVCKYTDVDMNDAHGHPVPLQDPRRYFCSMQLDSNGLATPAP
jgi:hypothetical protein